MLVHETNWLHSSLINSAFSNDKLVGWHDPWWSIYTMKTLQMRVSFLVKCYLLSEALPDYSIWIWILLSQISTPPFSIIVRIIVIFQTLLRCFITHCFSVYGELIDLTQKSKPFVDMRILTDFESQSFLHNSKNWWLMGLWLQNVFEN